MNNKNAAFILGLFETGLGVGRSLGRNKIDVYGFDFKTDIGFYSRYIKRQICPHPIKNENDFIEYLISHSKKFSNKPVLFITADDFLITVAKHIDILKEYLFINMPDKDLLLKITNKYEQFKLAKNANIDVPNTIILQTLEEIADKNLKFPVFIKGVESTEWRNYFGGSLKGIRCDSKDEFVGTIKVILKKNVKIIVQEVIEGPDTNHYKFNGYVSKNKELVAGFCLRKIRQNPPHFGVGSVVESVDYPELMEIGKRFFKAINYSGIGSAEFKLDQLDGKLKLIELNPRYWQQNSLATAIGINFPLIQYLDLTGQLNRKYFDYKKGIKWVNIYSDFDSFLEYRKEGSLNFLTWLKTLRGPKVFSDWAKDDVKPGFYEIRFGKRLYRIPKYLLKKIFK